VHNHQAGGPIYGGAPDRVAHDEEAHIDFLETQIELIAKIGLELYAQRHIGELDEN